MIHFALDAGPHTLNLAKKFNVKGLTIDGEQLVKEGIEKVVNPLREQGFAIAQIGAFGFNVLSEDKERQEQHKTMVKELIPIAAETGAKHIVINGGNYHPSGFGGSSAKNFTVEAQKELAEGLAPFLEMAQQHGVYISIEPYLKTAVHSAQSFLQLKELLPYNSLKINIDATSLYDFRDFYEPKPLIKDMCNTLKGHYGLVHIKEVAIADEFHLHAGLAPLGEGRTDWQYFLEQAGPNIPEDSWVVLEHVESYEEGENSIPLIRNIAQKAGYTLS